MLKRALPKVVVIRHGQGEQNVAEFFNSNPRRKAYRPVSLTALGRRQVAATARRLKRQGLSAKTVSAVYVSPLPRTRQTARIVSKTLGLPARLTRVRHALIETNMGSFEGKWYADFGGDVYDHRHAHEYGGETYDDVKRRIARFLRGLPRQGVVVIVTHGEPAVAIAECLTGKRGNLRRDIPPTGGTMEF